MAKYDDEDYGGGPGNESGEPECGADLATPEICEGMKDEPVDWNGQV